VRVEPLVAPDSKHFQSFQEKELAFCLARSSPESRIDDMSHTVDSPVGLTDSELEGYHRDGSELVVRIKAWNAKRLVATFTEVVGLRDRFAGSFSELLRDPAESADFMHDALKQGYETIPSLHPHHVFSFLNQDELPSLEIVAAGCTLSVE
jgi:hypothetical protein